MRLRPADLAFFLLGVDGLRDADRHFALAPADFQLLNPNTRTCPIFRSRGDEVPAFLDSNVLLYALGDAPKALPSNEAVQAGFRRFPPRRERRWTVAKHENQRSLIALSITYVK